MMVMKRILKINDDDDNNMTVIMILCQLDLVIAGNEMQGF